MYRPRNVTVCPLVRSGGTVSVYVPVVVVATAMFSSSMTTRAPPSASLWRPVILPVTTAPCACSHPTAPTSNAAVTTRTPGVRNVACLMLTPQKKKWLGVNALSCCDRPDIQRLRGRRDGTGSEERPRRRRERTAMHIVRPVRHGRKMVTRGSGAAPLEGPTLFPGRFQGDTPKTPTLFPGRFQGGTIAAAGDRTAHSAPSTRASGRPMAPPRRVPSRTGDRPRAAEPPGGAPRAGRGPGHPGFHPSGPGGRRYARHRRGGHDRPV